MASDHNDPGIVLCGSGRSGGERLRHDAQRARHLGCGRFAVEISCSNNEANVMMPGTKVPGYNEAEKPPSWNRRNSRMRAGAVFAVCSTTGTSQYSWTGRHSWR